MVKKIKRLICINISDTVKHIKVPGLLGCDWPTDFINRYSYCLKEAELPEGSTDLSVVINGITSKDADSLQAFVEAVLSISNDIL